MFKVLLLILVYTHCMKSSDWNDFGSIGDETKTGSGSSLIYIPGTGSQFLKVSDPQAWN